MHGNTDRNYLTDWKFYIQSVAHFLDRIIRQPRQLSQFVDRQSFLLHKFYRHIIEVHVNLSLIRYLLFYLPAEFAAFFRNRAFAVYSDIANLFPALSPGNILLQNAVYQTDDNILIVCSENQTAFTHVFPGIAPKMRSADMIQIKILAVIQAEAGKSYNIEVQFSHIQTYNANLKINVAKEFPIDYQQIINQIKGIDKVVFVGGISPALEGEEMPVNIDGFKGGDRTHIELPAVQRNFLKALKEAGKQLIFVSCSGSCIALQPETETCDAIVQVWYPGQEGGTAVADVLYGDVNPSGKLPVTFYKNSSQLPDYEDYSMKGRTYRYFNDALFPFGYGLSYTSFSLGEPVVSGLTVNVPVTNTGKFDGTETVQLYIRNLQDPEGPLKSLRAFQRVNVKAGKTVTAELKLTDISFEFWDPETNTMRVKPGKYEILVGTSSQDKDLKKLSISI